MVTVFSDEINLSCLAIAIFRFLRQFGTRFRFTNWSLLNLCISFLRISYQICVIITSQQLTKIMIMQLENQANLFTFYLESLNLLDRIKSNLDVLNYGKKLCENFKNKPFNSFKKQFKENLLQDY